MKTSTEERVDLPVTGMTCAACARAIERQLSDLEGVARAHVNFATNTATVEYDPARTGLGAVIGAIEEIGYAVPQTAAEDAAAAEEKRLRRRLWVGALCSVPLAVLGMSHGMFHLPGMEWIQLALTLPVVFYSGAPFYKIGRAHV